MYKLSQLTAFTTGDAEMGKVEQETAGVIQVAGQGGGYMTPLCHSDKGTSQATISSMDDPSVLEKEDMEGCNVWWPVVFGAQFFPTDTHF